MSCYSIAVPRPVLQPHPSNLFAALILSYADILGLPPTSLLLPLCPCPIITLLISTELYAYPYGMFHIFAYLLPPSTLVITVLCLGDAFLPIRESSEHSCGDKTDLLNL